MAHLQSASRVVAAMELLASNGPTRLDRVAEELGVHKSNALRLLATLRDHDWVAVDEATKDYSVGPGLISVGQAALSGIELQKALAVGEDLRDMSGETIHVSVPFGHKMLVVGRVDSLNALKVTCPVGTEDLIHTSAVGKAYLAALDDASLEAMLEKLDLIPATPATIVEVDELRNDIKLVRERRYATNIEETRLGTAAMAVALRSGGASKLLSLSITGPAHRFTEDVMLEIAPAMLEMVEPYQAL